MPTDAVCGTDPDILTILEETSFPRSVHIRSDIEAYSRKLPYRALPSLKTGWLGLVTAWGNADKKLVAEPKASPRVSLLDHRRESFCGTP